MPCPSPPSRLRPIQTGLNIEFLVEVQMEAAIGGADLVVPAAECPPLPPLQDQRRRPRRRHPRQDRADLEEEEEEASIVPDENGDDHDDAGGEVQGDEDVDLLDEDSTMSNGGFPDDDADANGTDDHEAEENDYEAQRLRNIARNQEMLRQLGLLAGGPAAAATVASDQASSPAGAAGGSVSALGLLATQAPKRKYKPRQKRTPDTPTRTSSRLQTKVRASRALTVTKERRMEKWRTEFRDGMWDMNGGRRRSKRCVRED